MNLEELEKSFNAIVGHRNELSQLDYSDEKYDDLEDAMHDLEDDFNEEYGESLEDILGDVHEQIKLDSDVLLPTAYILLKYVEKNGKIEVGPEDGVAVELDDFPDSNTRLMFLPNPLRLVFALNGVTVKEWDLKHVLSNS